VKITIILHKLYLEFFIVVCVERNFMEKHLYKIYCAGPLFNPKEREEMDNIAVALECSGYSVFLPQRDGLEFSRLLPVLLQRNVSAEDATKILNNAIFCLDVFHITDSHGLVLNMNGRVPDEGAMEEISSAFSAKFSKRADEFPNFQNSRFEAATQNGKEISSCLASEKDARDITDLLIDLFWERKCQASKEPRGSCSQMNSPQ
jgi:hypothetical protein